jgi:prepilin-type N-terminal cleavage/methylation domain-containing protein/prepilin-type processing-associated H-X9-DG protein
MRMPAQASCGGERLERRRLGKLERGAFTLVELLVVMAIIGVLVALLLPTLSASKRRAQRAHCINNLHQQGVALQAYLGDHHVYPGWPMWSVQLEAELSRALPNPAKRAIWRCPSAPAGKGSYYGYNAFGLLRVGIKTDSLGLLAAGGAARESVLRVGSKTDSLGLLAAGGAARESEVVKPADMMAIGDSLSLSLAFMRYQLGPENTPRSAYAFSLHQGRINVLLCDGHVESPALRFVFQDTNDTSLVRWNRDHQPHRDRL